MLKLAVFVCLVAVCCAQPPPEPMRPNISETFTSQFDLFRRTGDREERGKGKWDRSVTQKKFVSIDDYSTPDHKDFYEHLGLFETGKMYRIVTGRDGKMECTAEDLHGDFPNEWDWLKTAHYHKFEDPRTNKSYDAWEEMDPEEHERKILVVSETAPNMPVALLSSYRGEDHDMRFLSFVAEEPPSTAFTVPPECMQPPPLHGH